MLIRPLNMLMDPFGCPRRPRLYLPMAALALALAFAAPTRAQENAFTNPQVRAEAAGPFLEVTTSGMPDHPWERVNPNTPHAQNFRFRIPLQPRIAAQSVPVPSRGPIAVAVNGVVFFGPEDAQGKIAIENHGLDRCQGHPAPTGTYHYHSNPVCVYRDRPGEHSPVIGYAFDGFKIHGLQGEGGRAPTDLDPCNGHTDAERGYHYHATQGFPYVLGCYRGTPETSNYDRRQRQTGFGGERDRGPQEGRGTMGPSGGSGGEHPRVACENERRRHCPNMPPSPEFHDCMRRNESAFSQRCREALRNFPPPPPR